METLILYGFLWILFLFHFKVLLRIHPNLRFVESCIGKTLVV